jgi:hypothetical protein
MEFYYGYFPRMFYFILIPSLINHAHIKKYDHIINPIEKIFIFSIGLFSFCERTYKIYKYGLSIYDFVMYPSSAVIVYIYNVAKLSNGHPYSSLYHLIIHILGLFISVAGYMTYD